MFGIFNVNPISYFAKKQDSELDHQLFDMDDVTSLRNPETNERVPLGTKKMVIGRHTDNGCILLDDPYVSRFHAQITYQMRCYWIADLDSANGVCVNSQLVTAAQPLKRGDEIEIGKTKFIVC